MRNVTINVRGIYRWIAMPGDEIIVLPNHPLEVSVMSDVGIGTVNFICADSIDSGSPIMILETHTFPRDGERTVIQHYLEADNSFEARMARQKEAEERDAEYARKVAAGEIIEDDYGNEIYSDEA